MVINLYYAPFAVDATCLTGLTPAKILGVLLDRLGALNAVLADGAKTFGYLSVTPDSRSVGSARSGRTSRASETQHRSIRTGRVSW